MKPKKSKENLLPERDFLGKKTSDNSTKSKVKNPKDYPRKR